MRQIDETDLKILGLLLEDARRPYSEIAEKVDLSSPAVSDRVERLRELGVIKGFTLDVDRSMLDEGVPLLVELELSPGHVDEVRGNLADVEGVENVFVTADSRLIFKTVTTGRDITQLVSRIAPSEALESYDVNLLTHESWNPHLGQAELAVECDECGNRVTSEGESVDIDDRLYHFCCSSCRSKFEERYERLKEGA